MTSCADQSTRRARAYSTHPRIVKHRADITAVQYGQQQQRDMGNNATVIWAITTALYRSQRRRDNANNASVISLSPSSRHNGIVISRSRCQAFVIFRNISSAYITDKDGLLVQAYYSTSVLCDSSRLAHSTGVLLCAYAGMRIQRYGYMIICGYAHRRIAPLCVKPHGKIDQGPRYAPSRTLDTTLAGSKIF